MNNDYINSIVLKYKQKKGTREMKKKKYLIFDNNDFIFQIKIIID